MGVKVRQKGDKWYVFINHQGRRKAKCVGDSKKAAEEVKRKLEAKLTLGEFTLEDDKPVVPILQQYAAQWLDTYARLHCKESTYVRYAGVLHNHLLPALGHLPLDALTREQVRQLLAGKRQTLTPSSVRNILTPLREMLRHAVEDGLITSSPATQLGRFVQQRQAQRPEIEPLSREELGRLLETFQTQSPAYYPLFLCLARTGMRLGEVLAVQWGDIDFYGRSLTIRRSVVRGHITRPKNGKTRRIDMSRQLAEVLQDLQATAKPKPCSGDGPRCRPGCFAHRRGDCSTKKICARVCSTAR